MARTAASRKAYSVAEIDAMLKEPDRKTVNDGAGLILRKRGANWFWYYRTTSPETKKDMWISLAPRDPYPHTGLAAARQLAKINRTSVDTGIDPKEQKKREASATARQQADEAETLRRAVTLRTVFQQWRATDLKPRTKADGKRLGRKDGGQYVAEQFERHVFPALGDVAMTNIKKPDIMAILDAQKAAGKLRTANVLLADLKQLFDFAADREIIEVSPIGHIKKSKVGGDDVERDRTLSEDDIRALPGLIATAGLSKRTELAIWLILATGARVGELMGATWSNRKALPSSLQAVADAEGVKLGTVDLMARQWYIGNTKNQRDHTIHLSAFAVQQFEALAELREHDAWIFPDTTGTKPVCVKSFGKQIADRQRTTGKPMKNRSAAITALALPGGKWTAHDLRRTAATLMAKIGVTGDVINECLNHMQIDRMSRVYIRNRREAEQAIAFDKLGLKLQALTNGEQQNNVVSLPTRTRQTA